MNIPHGTTTRYSRYKCRCKECRAAIATYQRERRNRIAEERRADPDTPHGVLSTYTNYNCRCIPCTYVARDYQMAYRAKKKAAS